jgi:hypothetical protein
MKLRFLAVASLLASCTAAPTAVIVEEPALPPTAGATMNAAPGADSTFADGGTAASGDSESERGGVMYGSGN